MKKHTVIICLLSLAIAILTVSCEEISNALGVGDKPELNMQSVSIDSLDMEKITFNCDYAVSNPYNVGFSIDNTDITLNVIYDGDDVPAETAPSFTVSTSGLTVASKAIQTNSLQFGVPYNDILGFVNLVQNLSGATSLPFKIAGNIAIDLSGILDKIGSESLATVASVLTPENKLVLSVDKSFAIPVFKPKLSIDTSSVKFEQPSKAEIATALINGGLASLATEVLTNGISENILNHIDLDYKLNFDLNVGKEGSAAWNFLIDTCSLQSTEGTALTNISPSETNAITSESKTVKMSATLKSTKAAKQIIQLIRGTNSNPSFVLDSKLAFPELQQYGINLPLNYTKELPIN